MTTPRIAAHAMPSSSNSLFLQHHFTAFHSSGPLCTPTSNSAYHHLPNTPTHLQLHSRLSTPPTCHVPPPATRKTAKKPQLSSTCFSTRTITHHSAYTTQCSKHHAHSPTHLHTSHLPLHLHHSPRTTTLHVTRPLQAANSQPIFSRKHPSSPRSRLPILTARMQSHTLTHLHTPTPTHNHTQHTPLSFTNTLTP